MKSKLNLVLHGQVGVPIVAAAPIALACSIVVVVSIAVAGA